MARQPSLLTPELPDSIISTAGEGEEREKDTTSFHNRHGVRDQSQTAVSSHPTPRSYIVDGPTGTIRGDGRRLAPFPDTVAHAHPTRHTYSHPAHRPNQASLLRALQNILSPLQFRLPRPAHVATHRRRGAPQAVAERPTQLARVGTLWGRERNIME